MDDRRSDATFGRSCVRCGSSRLTQEPMTVETRAFCLLICLDCGHVDRRWMTGVTTNEPSDPSGSHAS
jgi:uncharacterized Zn finger protein